ncbi:hypothetical protein EVAR_23161_1 [Eumeta japonica]|uniref:Uncharacterized protein n=1 Tax=Eumeta variegata TaxID=151549 RepID=A0A4C1VC90_EUMVA|nr:hypothetical protein EVAR_23161_1 [Eumeta japonica]
MHFPRVTQRDDVAGRCLVYANGSEEMAIKDASPARATRKRRRDDRMRIGETIVRRTVAWSFAYAAFRGATIYRETIIRPRNVNGAAAAGAGARNKRLTGPALCNLTRAISSHNFSATHAGRGAIISWSYLDTSSRVIKPKSLSARAKVIIALLPPWDALFVVIVSNFSTFTDFVIALVQRPLTGGVRQSRRPFCWRNV